MFEFFRLEMVYPGAGYQAHKINTFIR